MLSRSVVVLCVAIGVAYYNEFSFFGLIENSTKLPEDELFTTEQLSKHDGIESPTLYLSLLGRVYDVTKGSKHYAPGSNYNIFVGRDASKSFITGEFTDVGDDLDDVLSLSSKDLLGLETWIQMYEEQYTYKGKHIGRFYDKSGKETKYLQFVKDKMMEGKLNDVKKRELNEKYPPCNSEWSASSGSRVWCTEKSGGIHRNWEGVPRQMHTPGLSEPHCVCVNLLDKDYVNNPHLKEFNGCEPLSKSCNITEEN